MKNKKIIDIYKISNILKRNKNLKKIVLCHGVFDLMHLGHVRHFQDAKKNGDILIVSLTPDKFVNKGLNRPVFQEKIRAEMLSSISIIDYVVINKWNDAVNTIQILKPDFYCKGSDYKDKDQDITKKIFLEEKAIKKVGGKIIYTKNIVYSSSNIINSNINIFNQEQNNFLTLIKKKYKLDYIINKINLFKKNNIFIIGESIIDRYVFCDALGKSGKEPVMVMRDLKSEDYLGGALAITNNLSNFCKKINLTSFIGQKNSYLRYIKSKLNKNIKLNFITKKNSETILKTRFIDSNDKRKLLGIYKIADQPLLKAEEDKIIQIIKKKIKNFDSVVVADYGHSLISSKVRNLLIKDSKFISVNAQVNASNIGLHTVVNYKNIDCLVINATELRSEMRDRDGNLIDLAFKLKKRQRIKKICVTRGAAGAFIINEKNEIFHCPAFATKVIDKIGAGDVLFSILSLCLQNKINEDLSLFISSIAAAFSVETVANSSLIEKIKVIKTIETYLK
jgi:rfaE bifunctional protein kinase chain/domain/rfaE bifunctional protein nucleotidyltransferase chain/domain